MISGSSQVDDIQKQKDINTKEFFMIISGGLEPQEKQGILFRLIQDGININEQNKYHYTPLQLCILLNALELVTLLIDLGADPNITTIADYVPKVPLNMAISSGNTRIIKSLVDAGANIDLQDSCGLTQLHEAVLSEDTVIAELLLSLGAKADIKTNTGMTPLHFAACKNNFYMVPCLLKYKVDIDAVDNNGNTPLHFALLRNDEIAEYLLNEGADLFIKNNAGESALKKAVLGSEFNELARRPIERSLSSKKKSLLVFINKLVEADSGRFDMLCAELGADFASVTTADDMVTKIVAQDPVQIERIIGIIEAMYFNTAKMPLPSLVSRLFDALDYSPAQECAASSSAASSSACIDDEQPPLVRIIPVTKKGERVRGSRRDEYEGSTNKFRP